MSADKRRGEARRLKLLRGTCDRASCSGNPPHGRIEVWGPTSRLTDLERLREDGYLVHKRVKRVGSGPNVRREYYLLTEKGWAAKASGRFE